jgi:hypothetical protein
MLILLQNTLKVVKEIKKEEMTIRKSRYLDITLIPAKFTLSGDWGYFKIKRTLLRLRGQQLNPVRINSGNPHVL